MAAGDDAQFDELLISTATVLRRAAAVQGVNYGQRTSALPTTVASGVPVRLSTTKGGREFKYDKKVVVSELKVFLNVPNSWTLDVKDWFLIDGNKYNILFIDNPSNMNHHLEAWVEILEP